MEDYDSTKNPDQINGPSYEMKFGKTLLENWVEEVKGYIGCLI